MAIEALAEIRLAGRALRHQRRRIVDGVLDGMGLRVKRRGAEGTDRERNLSRCSARLPALTQFTLQRAVAK